MRYGFYVPDNFCTTDCPQHWKHCLLVLSLWLDLLVYSVFPGCFPSLGFPSKGSPVSFNSDTSLAPNFIGKWCPFCGSVCGMPLLLWGRGGFLNHLLCQGSFQHGCLSQRCGCLIIQAEVDGTPPTLFVGSTPETWIGYEEIILVEIPYACRFTDRKQSQVSF